MRGEHLREEGNSPVLEGWPWRGAGALPGGGDMRDRALEPSPGNSKGSAALQEPRREAANNETQMPGTDKLASAPTGQREFC